MTAHVGTPPSGASVTSGTISTVTAIGAGDIKVNTISVPAMDAADDANARVDQLVAAINTIYPLTGVFAEKVTTSTYRLKAGVNIVIAALTGTATLANCGLTAATTNKTDPALLASRKQFGTNATGSDGDVVMHGNQSIPMKAAREMGLLQTVAGSTVQMQGAQTPTRTDA
jgi:hypothetical protein